MVSWSIYTVVVPLNRHQGATMYVTEGVSSARDKNI